MKKLGIIACSYGLEQGREPSANNERIAMSARIVCRRADVEDFEVAIVAQWEVALALAPALNTLNLVHVVREFEILDESRTDSEEIVAQAAREFKRLGITTVVIVAHFLQRPKVTKIARELGLEVLQWPLPLRINFDKHSDQWWTRGLIRCTVYIALYLMIGYGGPKYRGNRQFARSLTTRKR